MPHDSSSIPTTEPTELTAGTNWRWDRRLPAHLAADGWTLKYAVRGPEDLDVTATADDDTYQIRVTPAQSTIDAGTYRLIGYLEKGEPVTDRDIIYDAPLTVLANPLLSVGRRSHAEETLFLIEAAIEGRIPADRESFEIDGTQITRIPIDQLLKLRGRYAALVKRQRRRGSFSSVEVQFVRPS